MNGKYEPSSLEHGRLSLPHSLITNNLKTDDLKTDDLKTDDLKTDEADGQATGA